MMSHGFFLGTVSYLQSQMISDGVLRCGTPLCCPEGWRHQGRSKYPPISTTSSQRPGQMIGGARLLPFQWISVPENLISRNSTVEEWIEYNLTLLSSWFFAVFASPRFLLPCTIFAKSPSQGSCCLRDVTSHKVWKEILTPIFVVD